MNRDRRAEISDVTFAEIYLAIRNSKNSVTIKEVMDTVGIGRSQTSIAIIELEEMGCIKKLSVSSHTRGVGSHFELSATLHDCEFCTREIELWN